MKHLKIFTLFIIVLYISCTDEKSKEKVVSISDSLSKKPIDSVVVQKDTIDAPVLELKRNSAKFLWRKNVFDSELNDSISTIFINEAYCKTISDPEKAAIAYIATFVGNDCMWDGDATDDRSNLKCRILSALNLGYQCSDTHLNYLRKWFKNDTIVLEQLNDCPTIPYTATIQSTFEDIDIRTTKNKIWISYTATGLNMRDGSSWKENRIDEFKLINGTIKSGAITTTKKMYSINK